MLFRAVPDGFVPQQDKQYLKRRFAEGRIKPLRPAPMLDESVIDYRDHKRLYSFTSRKLKRARCICVISGRLGGPVVGCVVDRHRI